MNFQEVNELLDKTKNNRLVEAGSSLDKLNANPYNTLIPPTTTNKKSTLGDYVNQLKRQSSKTRFVKQYKKLSNDDIDYPRDDASLRIIDPVRENDEDDDDTNDHEVVVNDNDDNDDNNNDNESQIQSLLVSKKREEKRPMKRKVYINESANQIQNKPEEDLFYKEPQGGELNIDKFIPVDKAVEIIHQEIKELNDEIERQVRRINLNQEEISRYKEDIVLMDTQYDTIHYTLNSILKDHLVDMKQQKERIIGYNAKIQYNKKKNNIQKFKFERYRKGISIETRLLELDKKIKAALRRDEIWAGIRDWGFLSIILLLLVIATIITWKQS